MLKKALVVIDLQNDITKHYKEIIDNVNRAITWAAERGLPVVYIKHNETSEKARSFLPGTRGAELVPEMKIVSDHIFTKTKGNALTAEGFDDFIRENELNEFILAGADATACVKSTCFNMRKAGYAVTVLSDCVTSYDERKLGDMLRYYAGKGCQVIPLTELL